MTYPASRTLFWGRRALLLSAVALAAGCAQQPLTTGAATQAGNAPVRLMTSGGFAAAHKLLVPQFSAQTGIALESAYGSSMGGIAHLHPQSPVQG